MDYVILTHIHLDHAGGAGALMEKLPAAELLVHPRGSRHMADPSKLYAGATAVYGEAFMEANYGKLKPIEPSRIRSPGDEETVVWQGRPLKFLHTEGHAKHHFCIWDAQSKNVFTGDTFGLSYREFDTEKGPFLFPTTTPIHFDPDALHRSIDRIVALNPAGAILTHFSRVASPEKYVPSLHQQIDDFVGLALEHKSLESLSEALMVYLLENLRKHGVSLAEERCREILGIDVDINAQGLHHWVATRQG